MKIREIYKLCKEFDELDRSTVASLDGQEELQNRKEIDYEKLKEMDKTGLLKKIFFIDELYAAKLDEDSPDKKYMKDDFLIFSNKHNIDKDCLVICRYKDEFLLVNYNEDPDKEDIFTANPVSGNYPELTNQDQPDLKLFGMVLMHLNKSDISIEMIRKADNH